MISLRVAGAVAAAGVLAAGTFLLFRGGDEPEQARVRLVTTAVKESVLVDAQGTVLEQFSGDCSASAHLYLCERVRAELLASDPTLLKRGNLTIRTAIDPRTQRAAQEAIDRHVHSDDPQVAAEAMIVPATGEIRALATSHGSAPGFQQGNTAMVYPLAVALEKGLRYSDGFPSSDSYRAPGFSAFKNCKGQSVGDPSHSVVDVEGEHERAFTTLEEGTRAADNTFFLELTERVGLCESVTMAKRLGLTRFDGLPVQEFETFALGVNEVDPITVAGTYATFAARGLRCEPRAVTEVRSGAGVVRAFPPRCEQVLEAPVADAVTGLLAGALAGGPLRGIGRDAAGMDGTTDDYMTAGFAGYTPDLAAAVSLGDPRGPAAHKLNGVTIGGTSYEHVSGTSIPGPIWKDSMKAALEGTGETPFTEPDTARFGGCRDACAN